MHDARHRVHSISADKQRLGSVGWLWIRQCPHPEPVDDPEETDDERNEQRHLECTMPRVGVDADDLVLDLCWLSYELLFELGIRHDLGVMFERVSDLFLSSGRQDITRLRHVGEGV